MGSCIQNSHGQPKLARLQYTRTHLVNYRNPRVILLTHVTTTTSAKTGGYASAVIGVGAVVGVQIVSV